MKRTFHLRFWPLAVPALILFAVSLGNCGRNRDADRAQAGRSAYQGKDSGAGKEISATYVGRESCAECHEREYSLFQGSDHDMAMDTAVAGNVLGDFNGVIFEHLGVRTRFFVRDGQFMVNTLGEGGEYRDYRIRYVFGIRPLQQYLVEFPRGAFQMLPYCWDTRPASEGGQRWFHIYGDEPIPPDDMLFWTHIAQNYNYMCSECHSTNVRKDYDYESLTYHTSWSEVDVSCEACHGPASNHLEWARTVEQGGDPESFRDMGLSVRLKDQDNATWVFNMETGIAERSVPRTGRKLVDMCARCHARRAIMSEDYIHGLSFLQTHVPSLLDEGLYFADGQIQDEVYVYGSFLQSRMYQKGVVCKDCHEPHSGKVYTLSNALCYRCHLAEKYGSREHHFHDPEKEGSSCVECHMPERTYMVIDPRRDHSMRIPRPDLSDLLNSPNACIKCHTDKSNSWAAGWCRTWYGEPEDGWNPETGGNRGTATTTAEGTRQEAAGNKGSAADPGTKHYGVVFWMARNAYPEALPGLVRLAEDTETAPMIRATAVSLLRNYQDPAVLSVIRNTIADPDPLIRYAAVSSLSSADDNVLVDLAVRRLNDPVRLVRTMAAFELARVPEQYFGKTGLRLRENVLKEYVETQMINADHPSAHMNLGILALNQGDYAKAEAYYRQAIEIEPGMTTAYINLADLYRLMGKDREGERILREAIKNGPEMAAVNYALGLNLVRSGDYEQAMENLKEACRIEPGNARYAYVYAVGLNSTGRKEEAVEFLEQALQANPFDRDLLYSLSTFCYEQARYGEALEYAEKLVEYYPADPNYSQLLQALRDNPR